MKIYKKKKLTQRRKSKREKKMEKEYSVKLYDDSVVKFKLISKDVFDELLTHQGWVEYSDPFTYECSLVFTKAYTNGSEFIALKEKNIKEKENI